jgi:hypothetical protein
MSAPDRLLDATLEALAHLLAGADNRKGMMWPKSKIEDFDGFELFDNNSPVDDDVILLGNDAADAPVWPMDARMGGMSMNNGIEGVWIFKRITTLRPCDWRGRLRITTPRMVEVHDRGVWPNGDAVSSVAAYAVVGGRAVDADTRNHSSGGRRVRIGDIYGGRSKELCAQDPTREIALGHGIELRKEYRWSVLLGEEGIPRARFVTDPTGIREVFRLRDIPCGASRRAALRHWVRDHWRKKRDPGADDLAFIRTHMRGRVNFAWQGLSCQIEPSRDDLRRAAA